MREHAWGRGLAVTINQSFLKKALWLAVAVGAVLYCRHYWDEAPGLSLFIAAGRCMLDGMPLQNCDATFTYPPLFALTMIPLVPLPMVLQNLAWYLLTVLSIIGCITLSARMAQRLAPMPSSIAAQAGDASEQWSQRDLAWLYVLGVLLSVKFILAAIGNQSYDAFVVVLVMVGLVALADERPGLAGASLALAAALKATPVLFLPYLLLKRHYMAAAAMTAMLAFACILPDLVFTVGRKPLADGYFVAWLHQVAGPALSDKMDGNPHTFWWAANPNNLSLRGLVGAVYGEGYPAFRLILHSVDAAFAAIVGLLILRSGNGRQTLTIDGALLLISMLMLSPMTSQSHYVAVILPIFAAVAVWLRGDAMMRKVAGVILLANIVLPNATSKDLVGGTVTFWAKEFRLLIFDALLFVVFFAVLVLRPKPTPESAARSVAVERSTA